MVLKKRREKENRPCGEGGQEEAEQREEARKGAGGRGGGGGRGGAGRAQLPVRGPGAGP